MRYSAVTHMLLGVAFLMLGLLEMPPAGLRILGGLMIALGVFFFLVFARIEGKPSS